MCHVLIIEDEPIVAADLEMLFASNGATSFAFADTYSGALTEARHHRPEFISSDVHLAEGNGAEAVAAIHEEHGHIPVIYVTGTPEDCTGCPAHLIVAKPLDHEQLRQMFLKHAPLSEVRN